MQDPNEAPDLGAEAGKEPVVQCGGKIACILGKWEVKREKSLLEKIQLFTNWGFLFSVLWACWDWRQNCENYINTWITLNIKIHAFCYPAMEHVSAFLQGGSVIYLLSLSSVNCGKRSSKSVCQSELIANGFSKNETDQIFMTVEGYAVLMKYFNRELVYKIEDVCKTFSNLIVAFAMGYFVWAAEADVYLEIWRFVNSILKIGFIDWAIFQLIVTVCKGCFMFWAIFKFIVAIVNYNTAASNAKAADEQWNCFLNGNEGKKLGGSLEPIVASSIVIEKETSV
ncbi:hypothetical protein Ocin01_13248 [Orchesella cincta]|uniref:Uncharacterized protein n=1 Tax=Orchesella cincta TaxID=48709 RepID=A0A1D2MKC3_ORCCI|nr:hypothetical protein Ocin01_13248 [Orchesella cincta]